MEVIQKEELLLQTATQVYCALIRSPLAEPTYDNFREVKANLVDKSIQIANELIEKTRNK